MTSRTDPSGTAPAAGRRIGLVVDHPIRDLHGLTLVAHLLAQQGHTAILLPFYGQSFDLPLLDLDLLVLNYVRLANLQFIRAAQHRGVPLAVLDTEGGLLPDDGPTSPRGVARFLSQTGLDCDLSLYMFWGSAIRDVIIAETGLEPHRAVVTGCPRFDLAHEPWSSQAAEHDIVLINTNFAGVNAAHAVDGEVDWLALRSMGYEEARLQRMVAAAQDIMRDMIAIVAQIAAARPHRKFVLRPHPFERAEAYRQSLGHLPNLEIRCEGNVLDVIARSACLLHVNCTTAVEAAMSGVPPISLEFINQPEIRRFAEVAGKVSHPANSLEESLALLDRGRELGPAAGLETIEPAFGPSDGCAAHRVVEAITSVLNAPVPAKARPAANGFKPALLSLAGATVGSAAIERGRQSLRPARRGKELHFVEVQAALARFSGAQGVTRPRLRRIHTAIGMPALSLEIATR